MLVDNPIVNSFLDVKVIPYLGLLCYVHKEQTVEGDVDIVVDLVG